MNYRTRREALRTAAKVALSFSTVAACGGSVAAVDVPSETRLAPDYEVDAPAGPASDRLDAATKKRDASDDSAAREGDAGPAVTETFAQCEARLAAFTGDAGWVEFPSSPAFVSCCDTIVKAIVEDQTFKTDSLYVWQCCTLLSDNVRPFPEEYATACVAWGPPMPPAFEPAADLFAEVA